MRLQLVWTASALAALGLALPAPLPATDVDGPNDCTRIIQDWGDAPEGSDAYPGGVIGHFPTCAAFTPPGNQTSDCTAISSAPGQTGYVTNVNDLNGYWLGCAPVGSQPLGIDSDITGTMGDGKVNSTGGPVSFCNPNLAIDCVEPAFGMNFGQDERYGSDDAGIATAITFACCANATVTSRGTLVSATATPPLELP